MQTPAPTALLAAGAAVRGLGLDAGGTQTRWAVAAAPASGGAATVVAQGSAPPLSGLQLMAAEGRAAAAALFAGIARDAGPLQAVVAGVTGFDAAQAPLLAALAAEAFEVDPAAVRTMSDIELLCRAAPPGAVVVYAGTGSVAACLRPDGTLDRAGGRGALIDDAGGGHWIACRALRFVWRAEDDEPGAWRRSALARRLFDRIGGSDWAATRAWAHGANRGDVGRLALAVAAAASDDGDATALALLREAGGELARLASALTKRHPGAPAVVMAGRVFDLNPAVGAALRDALPVGLPLQRLSLAPQHAAARLACGALPASTGQAPLERSKEERSE